MKENGVFQQRVSEGSQIGIRSNLEHGLDARQVDVFGSSNGLRRAWRQSAYTGRGMFKLRKC